MRKDPLDEEKIFDSSRVKRNTDKKIDKTEGNRGKAEGRRWKGYIRISLIFRNTVLFSLLVAIPAAATLFWTQEDVKNVIILLFFLLFYYSDLTIDNYSKSSVFW